MRSASELETFLLQCNGSLWDVGGFDRVRAMIRECCRCFRTGSEHQHQRQPEFFILLALQYVASREMMHTIDVLDEASLESQQDEDADDDDSVENSKLRKCLLFAMREVC
eukprot:CAMPEP_0176465260 /NCGR_PEP_ID=MMETSP0127-20121128/37113_1 /TAXON_ID=938130 /ORGANISM="Platyophrya macrostoma, Strain WH" /LENGTH=109 /DNA_ID=CAMNT_0017858047 /DNA_START=161 /DNA_END=487 /DNA_ORIENTATION=-